MLVSNVSANQIIRKVEWSGAANVDQVELGGKSFLKTGVVFSDSLLDLELARVDSVYFSCGLLAVEIQIDTFTVEGGTGIRLTLYEGERTTVGKITVTGEGGPDRDAILRELEIFEGDFFEPVKLKWSMAVFLEKYNNSGYPFAQIWMTGFAFDDSTNSVDLVFSIYKGDLSKISRIVFEGITKTDSSIAVRISRLKKGKKFVEKDLQKATRYLRASGLFKSTGRIQVVRNDAGAVDLIVPVTDMKSNNNFQGAFGFSRKDDGDYRVNGSVRLELRNMAGKGRNVSLNWLNDGQKYSRTELLFTEPFLFSMPVHMDSELKQTVHDTLYDMASGGVYFRIPLGPVYSVIVGVAAERTIFGDGGALERNSRQRYRVGLARDPGYGMKLNLFLEGARKKSWYTGGNDNNEGQLLYRFEGSIEAPVLTNQGIYARLVSEGVFSSGYIPFPELFLLGGARSLRGYRENQFRGEKTGYLNLEYRFGAESRIFFFDDIGAFYREGNGWEVRNGMGFGIRSVSQIGVVELSFGVGDEISLSSTRIHISLAEKF